MAETKKTVKPSRDAPKQSSPPSSLSSSVVEAGDFVRLEFSGKTQGSAAGAGSVFESSAPGKPVLVAAGRGQVIAGLDEALAGSRVGEKRRVAIPKEKAFGSRNPDLVRLVPLQKFREQGIAPAPGLVLDIDGARARVQSVGGGRVRVDFNHDLAGQDVEYDFEVKRVFKAPAEKIAALADDLLAPFDAKASLDAASGVARVAVPAKARKDADFVVRKLRFVSQALQFVSECKRVVFEEEYALPAK